MKLILGLFENKAANAGKGLAAAATAASSAATAASATAEAVSAAAKAAVCVACAALLLVSAVPLAALAGEVSEMPDPDRKGSLSITFTCDGEAISGGNKAGIYKVADVVEDNGFKYVWRQDFDSVGEMPADLDEANAALSSKLDRIAQEKRLTLYQKSRELDENGKVTFSDLEPGLYLVVHTVKTEITLSDKSKVKYTINPFIVSIPQKEGGKYVYDVATNPKVSPEKDTTPPPDVPKPRPPRVPQTGQLWWPVMALGAAGVLFICAGLVRKSRNN